MLYLGYFQDYLHIYLHRNQIKDPVQQNSVDLSMICMINKQQAEWLYGNSIKSYNDLAADIIEWVTKFPGILV